MLRNKLLLTAAICIISGSAYADEQGIYIGGQIGMGDMHYSDSDYFPNLSSYNQMLNVINSANKKYNLPQISLNKSSSENGLAGRLYLGYQFQTYLAVELGYTLFNDDEGKISASGHLPIGNFSFEDKTTISEHAVDLSLKGLLPLGDSGFTLYAKGGAAYITAEFETKTQLVGGALIGSLTPNFTAPASDKHTENSFRPVYGAGISYNLNDNLSMDISWTRIQGDSKIKDADLAAVGLTYREQL